MGNPLSDFSCTFGNCNARQKPTTSGQLTQFGLKAMENAISLLYQYKTWYTFNMVYTFKSD